MIDFFIYLYRDEITSEVRDAHDFYLAGDRSTKFIRSLTRLVAEIHSPPSFHWLSDYLL